MVGADAHRLPFGLTSGYLQSIHYLTCGTAVEFEAALLQLLERLRPDVFLPLGTAATAVASRNLERLRRLTAINVPTLDAFQMAYDKARCAQECHASGVPHPQTLSLAQARSLLAAAPAGTRVVVKPAFDVGAAVGVLYPRDPASLESAWLACRSRYGEVLVQEYIPGGPESMKTAILLLAPSGRLSAWFTTQKTRVWPPSGGSTATSTSSAEFVLIEQVLPLFEKWQWRGPAEVEFKLDPRDGRHKVIEINPRFPGYLRFPCRCGLNLATLAVEAALGSEVKATASPMYKVGAAYVNPGFWLRAGVAELSANPRPWLRFLREIGKAAREFFDLVQDPQAAAAVSINEGLCLLGRNERCSPSEWCWLPDRSSQSSRTAGQEGGC